MLRSRADFVADGSELSLQTWRYAKGAALALAAIAVTVCAFDLSRTAVVEPAIEFIGNNYKRLADWERTRSQVDRTPDLVSRPTPSDVAKSGSAAAGPPAPDVAIANAGTLPVRGANPAATAAVAANPMALHARLPSPAALMHLTASTLGRAKQCLASAIYFEARNEPVRGQIAVAQVVVNRVFSGFYPNDLCDVVYQNASRHLDCQFTFACDGKRNVVNERGAWARAQQIANQVLAGDLYDAAVGSSTHYHALYVRPDWVMEMKKLARYGTHNFYRPVAWGDGADAPVWGIVPLPPDKTRTP